MQRMRSVVVGAVSVCLAGAPATGAEGYEVGDTLPGFIAVDVDGQTVDSADFAGSYVLIDLCTMWCAPCQLMAPDAGRAEEALNDAGIDFVYVQALFEDVSSQPSDQADAQAWREAFSVDADVLILHESGLFGGDLVTMFAGFNEGSVPTVAFMTPGGVVFDVGAGYLSPEAIVLAVATHAGVPVPPLPPQAPVPPTGASSAPAPVANAIFGATIGGDSATTTPFAVDPKTGALGFDFLGSALPMEWGQALIQGVVNEPASTESWIVALVDIGKPPIPVSHAAPITIEIDSPTWAGGCVALSGGTATLEIFDSSYQLHAAPSPDVPLTIDGTVVRLGPFTLGGAGIDPGTDVLGVQLSTPAFAAHSLALSVDALGGEIEVDAGDPASFTAVTTGGDGPLVYQWQYDGVDLVETAPYSGTTTATLAISAVSAAEDGYYGVRVTDGCRTVHSGYVRLDVQQATPCPGDCDPGADGSVGIEDLLAMLASWGGPGPCDLDGSRSVGIEGPVGAAGCVGRLLSGSAPRRGTSARPPLPWSRRLHAMTRLGSAAVLLTLLLVATGARGQDGLSCVAYFEGAVEVDDVSYPYRLLAPETVEAGKRYPLVLFLHGAGERGRDNNLQLKHFPRAHGERRTARAVSVFRAGAAVSRRRGLGELRAGRGGVDADEERAGAGDARRDRGAARCRA